MIPFGSQRGFDGDLATHLMNAHDNECVELADLRGAIAGDLHGAFSEWEAMANAMTKAENYLYSLSINPDPSQGPLTREQYEDYIVRAEESLGLNNQPRAVVFHIKEGNSGDLREHCHVVWSRTDVQVMKAIPIAFDRQKLMMVSRQFAHDHELALPEGYRTGKAKAKQLSLYEKAQQDQTGLTKEQRMELITDLWRCSNTPKAFVSALEDNGYMLAAGRRPYVLVDIYGQMNALPRMIDDKSVRTKDVQEFLEKEFPPEGLPDVEDAKKIAAQHLNERNQLQKSEQLVKQMEVLKRSQDQRREELEAHIRHQSNRHNKERSDLILQQTDFLSALKLQFAQKNLEVEFNRAQYNPTGLAAFLAKVSGSDLVRRTYHNYQDRKREARQNEQQSALELQHKEECLEQQRSIELQMMDLRRKEHALEKTFKREIRSCEMAQTRQKAIHFRKEHEHMPSIALTPSPTVKPTALHKATKRYFALTANAKNVKHGPINADKNKSETVDLQEDFAHAAGSDYSARSGTTKGPEEWEIPRRTDRDSGRDR